MGDVDLWMVGNGRWGYQLRVEVGRLRILHAHVGGSVIKFVIFVSGYRF